MLLVRRACVHALLLSPEVVHKMFVRTVVTRARSPCCARRPEGECCICLESVGCGAPGWALPCRQANTLCASQPEAEAPDNL